MGYLVGNLIREIKKQKLAGAELLLNCAGGFLGHVQRLGASVLTTHIEMSDLHLSLPSFH